MAIFDYAYNNKHLYKNESIFFYKNKNSFNVQPVIDNFEKKFKCYMMLTNDIQEIKKRSLFLFYSKWRKRS